MKHINRKVALSAVGAFLIFAGALGVIAQKHMHGHGGGMFGLPNEHFLANKLDLNDQQKQQLHSLITAQRDATKPYHQQLAGAFKQINDAATASPFDESRVRQIVNQNVPAFTEVVVAHARFRSEFWKILTPEQQAKAKALHQRMHGGMEKHGETEQPQ